MKRGRALLLYTVRARPRLKSVHDLFFFTELLCYVCHVPGCRSAKELSYRYARRRFYPVHRRGKDDLRLIDIRLQSGNAEKRTVRRLERIVPTKFHISDSIAISAVLRSFGRYTSQRQLFRSSLQSQRKSDPLSRLTDFSRPSFRRLRRKLFLIRLPAHAAQFQFPISQ